MFKEKKEKKILLNCLWNKCVSLHLYLARGSLLNLPLHKQWLSERFCKQRGWYLNIALILLGLSFFFCHLLFRVIFFPYFVPPSRITIGRYCSFSLQSTCHFKSYLVTITKCMNVYFYINLSLKISWASVLLLSFVVLRYLFSIHE